LAASASFGIPSVTVLDLGVSQIVERNKTSAVAIGHDGADAVDLALEVAVGVQIREARR
jgi:hypothetical protein